MIMKKIFLVLTVICFFCACADEKTFVKVDGTEFTAKPYGWMTKDKAIDGVDYELCVPNIVLSCIFSETIVAPVLLTGLDLWEPVSYTDPSLSTVSKESNEQK